MSITSNNALETSDDARVVPPEVKQYQRSKLTTSIASLVLSFALLVLSAVWLGPVLDAAIRRWVGPSPWLRLPALALAYAAALELLTLPLDFWSGYVLEHRYHLSNQTLAAWLWRQIKGYLLGGSLGLLLLYGLYAVIWLTGDWWWVYATAGWLVITLILGQLLPVLVLPLFYKVTKLENVALLEQLRRIAEGTGLAVEGIYQLHLSQETRKANAALAGLGRTRRVLLGDTLLEQFTSEEIEVVFAHEVGHHVHRHIVKLIVWSTASAAASFWLADLLLRITAVRLSYPADPVPAYADPAALPLLLLVLTTIGLVLSPAQNGLSRFFERQCDWYALTRTGLRDAYRTAFLKLAKMNKADTNPHPLVVWLFDDHPPIRERLALADKFLGEVPM